MGAGFRASQRMAHLQTLMMPATVAISPQAQPASAERTFYRSELDVLRFFAFLAVFTFHFSRPVDAYVEHGVPRIVATVVNGLMQGGVFGVDLFFVLSAYLITDLLLREKEEFGELDVKSFYLRRILRIWPLYFFYIGLALLPVFNPDRAFTWQHAAAYIFLAGNWSVVLWGWPGHSIIGPLWTVSIEEQFYLAWPPIVRRISRQGLPWAAVGMLAISNITRLIMVAAHGDQNSVWCNTLARLDPIAAGILVAAALRGRLPTFGRPARLIMLVAGVVPLALVANFWKIQGPQSLEWIPTLVGFPVVAVSCTLILLCILGISTPLPRLLIYLGKISYGLYVYHALGILISSRIVPAHSGLIQLVLRPVSAFAITVLLSSISYALLEKPFLKMKHRFTSIYSRPI
jgi:peptidoglycan/LPS O-acetylase OafA/YrhL